MDVLKPRWTSAAYLLYLGGLTVLVAASYSLAYLSRSYGEAAYVAWALLVLVVLSVIATAFRRAGRWIAAGLFAFAAVVAFGAFVAALWSWFGWLSTSFVSGFHVGSLALDLLVVAAALVALRRFRFPFISMIAAVVGWYFVADLLSNGGNWTATVTLLVGLVYLGVAAGLDSGERRPSAFWFHLVSGLLIGGSLVYFWHSGTTGWILVALLGLAYIGFAALTGRSSWAVLGSFGVYAAAFHFGERWARATIVLIGGSPTSQREWVPPIVTAAVGFLFVLLGLWLERRHRAEPAPLPSV
jgi:hypothetical protein